MPNLKSINGVEIFSSGTWNNETYSVQDLDEMVRAFEENKKGFRPYLKLGHNEDQQLIQEDGLPAAGWIGNLYRRGEKLIADFVDLPEKIYQLIEKGAYRKVSSEIFWNIDIKGSIYPRMLAAVALLGADSPAVMNLDDILSMYGIKDFGQIKIYAGVGNDAIVKTHNYIPAETKGRQMSKTEAELKLEMQLQAEQDKMKELLAQVDAQKSEMSSKDAELETLRAEKAAADKKALEAEQKRAEVELNATIDRMASEKTITPAMKPYMKELLGAHKSEYSFSGKDGEKKYSRTELVEKILKLHTASEVNVEESSEDGQQSSGSSDDVINAKIEKFMADNKVSYKVAYKAVVKATAPRASGYLTEEA